MKTQGEIEAAVCEGITHFEQQYMGMGPKAIHAHLFGDLLVVRLHGVLTAAEQQLVKSLPAEKGRDLLKQVRTHMFETARPLMEKMIEEITGVETLSFHHDVSTATGEEVVLFTLIKAPPFREIKKKEDQLIWAGRHKIICGSSRTIENQVSGPVANRYNGAMSAGDSKGTPEEEVDGITLRSLNVLRKAMWQPRQPLTDREMLLLTAILKLPDAHLATLVRLACKH